ncbi:MAG: trypsin-like peptidase domain-containing protein [Anaerolineaceae bacterium]|nr:MAG: trypsin-like peptidase domain-containing protein [Anaerolineaceae bacterium]
MSENILNLSTGLAETVSAASPAVVRVEGRRRLPATGIVWSDDGLILTASHVVRRDEGVRIGLPDGRSVAAQLIGRDRTADIALLRAETDGLVPLQKAGEENQAVGQLTLALGRPGESVQSTLGIISALGNPWRTHQGGLIDRYLQTDVLMYPGFSGGPLVDVEAKLLGMNSSALLPGVSIALPVSSLKRVTQALLTHGRIRRGYLGVSTQRVSLPRNVREELGQKKGLLVVAVETDSPAESGGLTLGDTIVGIGKAMVRSHNDLLAHLAGDYVGQKVPIKILRGGEIQTINVKIGERP